jgi:2-keto-3-deoxy-6-phosphogluconate aldolase
MQALASEGWTLASVPAEAPAGLGALASMMDDSGMMLGAATVVSVEQVKRAAESGAAFISCPHVDPEIIERCVFLWVVV